MRLNLLRMIVLILAGTFMLVLQSCVSTLIQPTAIITSSPHPSSSLDNSTQVYPTIPTLTVETSVCIEKTVSPTIAEIQPPQIVSGSEITIIGTGGYIQNSCGGINESARRFNLYLNNETVGDLICYANHCEAKIVLSGAITSGLHCLSTQQNFCEFEFEIATK